MLNPLNLVLALAQSPDAINMVSPILPSERQVRTMKTEPIHACRGLL